MKRHTVQACLSKPPAAHPQHKNRAPPLKFMAAYEIDPVYGTRVQKVTRPPSQAFSLFFYWITEIRDIFSDLLLYPSQLLQGSHTLLYLQSYRTAQRALLRCYAQFCDFTEQPDVSKGDKVLMYSELNALQYTLDFCQSAYTVDDWDFCDPYVIDSDFPL